MLTFFKNILSNFISNSNELLSQKMIYAVYRHQDRYIARKSDGDELEAVSKEEEDITRLCFNVI